LKKALISTFLLSIVLPMELFTEEESLDLIYQKISILEQEIATLRNLIEENTYLIERYQELQQQRYLDLDKRLHSLLSNEVDDLEQGSVLPQNANNSEEVDLYKKALIFFEESRYSEALGVFQELIITFPDGEYSADSYFWSGELFSAQGQFLDARENYLVVIQKYSNHNRVADSLYKLGLVEEVLGNEEEANTYYSKLISDFPETGAAELAKKSMKTLLQESN
tara:strand:+ start:202 stop:873 length:672 start_codon:yes stop_codon:yes gene_type:complete